ncbi:hypothetical protein NC652_027654 [Populus alba x Populus x berolinensis]|nr:hypothetical protein NC652_027654 [Populus alba x Populus x berolinensis]
MLEVGSYWLCVVVRSLVFVVVAGLVVSNVATKLDHTIGQMDMKFEKKGKCWRSSLYFATIS